MKQIRSACLLIVLLCSTSIDVEAKPALPIGTVEAKNLPSNLWGTWRVSSCAKTGKSLTVKGMSVRFGSVLWHVTGVQPSQGNGITATMVSGDQTTFQSGKLVFQIEAGTGSLVVDGVIQGRFRRSCP